MLPNTYESQNELGSHNTVVVLSKATEQQERVEYHVLCQCSVSESPVSTADVNNFSNSDGYGRTTMFTGRELVNTKCFDR